jgi:hypothetical protein
MPPELACNPMKQSERHKLSDVAGQQVVDILE